jgi:predicted RNA-binding protein Jag
MVETEDAINRVVNGETDSVELRPQSNFLRRLQHQMAERYNLNSESRGREPYRRVRITK